ncbi:MAG: AIPR family protein [Burkholderiales bacterium]|nr:AIPR family protein [Burkholderiales bacterium]
MNIEDFYESICQEVLDESSSWESSHSSGDAFNENVFTNIVLEDYSSSGLLESPVCCHHEFSKGNLIGKISGYGIPTDDSVLDLIITDYEEQAEIRKVNQGDVEKRFNQAVRFLDMALSDEALEIIDIGSDVHAMIDAIQTLSTEGLRAIKIHLLSNAVNVARNYNIEKEINGIKVGIDVFDLERFRRYREGGATQEKMEIDLRDFNDGRGIQCSSFVHEEYYDTALVILPGMLLYKLYEDFGGRLLELNVRSYLQAKGKVNRGILQTIMTEPERFLTYNNGITMVAEEIVFNEDHSEIIKLLGMQIVNGGQTTASIHRALKDNNCDLGLVKVQAKITMVPSRDFEQVVPLISKFSNTQNKISDVDLNAHHPFHIAVERISRTMYTPDQSSKWFFERSRGGYQTEKFRAKTPAQKSKFNKEYPVSQKITKEDVARFFNVWNLLPHFVNQGGQKNFVRFMTDLSKDIKKDWEMPKGEFQQLVAKAIVYKKAQSLARQLKIPAYRVNVVNFSVSLLVHKTASRINLLNIWKAQEVSEDLVRIMEAWIPKVYELMVKFGSGGNPGEVFKKEETWKRLIKETKDWSLGAVDKGSLKTISKEPDTNVDVENDIARCTQIDSDEWSRIVKWGTETDSLHWTQIGIATTLFKMSCASWSRPPSEKQARAGMKIVEKFRQKRSSD